MLGFFKFGNWNENNLNPLSRINWRASLVPAAAVIPAPIAYTKVVAVKKLVVEFLAPNRGLAQGLCTSELEPSSRRTYLAFICWVRDPRHLL